MKNKAIFNMYLLCQTMAEITHLTVENNTILKLVAYVHIHTGTAWSLAYYGIDVSH